MARRRKVTGIMLASIPVSVFIILQSLGVGIFPIKSIFEPKNPQMPTELLRTGLMLTQSGSNVYVAWIDASSNQDIFFRASSDAGRSFDSIIDLSIDGNKSVTRSIASKGSAVYVAWVDEVNGSLDVLFRRSIDGGKSFGDIMNLSSNAGSSEFPVIDADGPAVYVVWIDNTHGNDEIMFRATHDAGATFGETMNLSGSSGNSETPNIIAEGSNVYVAWHDDTSGNYEIMFRASYDAGKTFGPVINLSDNSGNSGFASLAVDGADIHVAWIDETLGNHEIFIRSSNDGGSTFSQQVNLSKSDSKSGFPVIDADGPLVCIAWIEEEPVSKTLVFTCSMAGSPFHDPIRMVAGKELESHMVDVEGTNVFVAWVDASTEVNVMLLRRSIDAGASFSSPVDIGAGRIEDARITAKGTNVYTVWSDMKCNDEQCTSIDINAYFRRSIDSGFTFEAPMKLNK